MYTVSVRSFPTDYSDSTGGSRLASVVKGRGSKVGRGLRVRD